MRLRSGHSASTSHQVDRVVTGGCDTFRMSSTDAEKMTDSSGSAIKEQTWQSGSVQGAALPLENSARMLSDKLWSRSTWTEEECCRDGVGLGGGDWGASEQPGAVKSRVMVWRN